MSQPFASPGPNPGQQPHRSPAGVPRPPAADAAALDPLCPLDDPIEIVPEPSPLPAPTAAGTPPQHAAPPSATEDDLLDVVPDDDPLEVVPEPEPSADGAGPAPRLDRPRRGRRLVQGPPPAATPLTPQQRLLLLDIWNKSGLPARDFAALVGLSRHTLHSWKKRFELHGPAGLLDQPHGRPEGSALPDLTRRTILMLKRDHPDWGCQKISDLLLRGPALPASPQAVARVLHEAGYQLEDVPTRPHPDKVRHFERARPNQLWQTDLFTFVLKRQNRRVYLVAFLDDHSRFLVGYGLHVSQSSALVLEVLRAALTNFGSPEEILTDNGSQYVTWRGQSAFHKELLKRGIRQVVAAPRRPQTLGKVERFWGTLWRECLEAAVFLDLGDAQRRIGLFIDHYNFQRPHQGIDGLVPADRFFGAAPEVRQALAARVAANALELARQGLPRTPFYLTGQVGGRPFSVHAEGERVILTDAGGDRREVELTPPGPPAAALPEPVCPAGEMAGRVPEAAVEPGVPGASPLDEGLQRLRAALPAEPGGDA
jgi:transposase InsO family protein